MLKKIIENVYIPKLNVKRFSPYFYTGENERSYYNYREFQTNHRNPNDDLILGIESSFNDTAAALVTSHGSVFSNEVRSFPDHYQGADAPLKAKEHHVDNLPIVVAEALKKAGKRF